MVHRGLADPSPARPLVATERPAWLPPRGVLVVAGLTAALLFVDLVIKAYDRYFERVTALKAVFDVGGEGNVAAWWNATLLLGVAALALLVMALTGRRDRRSWLALAAAVAVLSLDETISLHERLGEPVGAWAKAHAVALPTYAWVLPGAAIAALGIVLFVLWARTLPPGLRYGLLGALALYLTGALAAEAVNGWFKQQGASLRYLLGTSIEETLEMGACLVAIAVLARTLTFDKDPLTGARAVRLRAGADQGA
jgi:hypothetical protein